jgi:hypothetical protein
MRLLYAAALGVALASPSLAQQTNPLDTRMCPDGSATLPDGSPCPPLATQQGGSMPGEVPGAAGNASRNNNNTGGSTVESGGTGPVDTPSSGSGATGTGVQ